MLLRDSHDKNKDNNPEDARKADPTTARNLQHSQELKARLFRAALRASDESYASKIYCHSFVILLHSLNDPVAIKFKASLKTETKLPYTIVPTSYTKNGSVHINCEVMFGNNIHNAFVVLWVKAVSMISWIEKARSWTDPQSFPSLLWIKLDTFYDNIVRLVFKSTIFV